jgi:ubiquinone/menaquinone biosynthesis C-methylase UbiE
MTANQQGRSSSSPGQDPRFPADSSNTYTIGIEHMNSEMARLMGQERMLNEHMPLLPPGIDLSEQAHVLDIACGPGGWAMEVGFHYPDMQVVGVDINQQLVDYATAMARVQGLDNVIFLPMNVTLGFDQTDASWQQAGTDDEDEASPTQGAQPSRDQRTRSYGLDFPDSSFDFVNARFMMGFLKEGWWPRMVAEMARVARPGGILRLTECNSLDVFVTNSPAVERYRDILNEAMKSDKRLSVITPNLGRWLKQAGCVEVKTTPHLIEYSVGSKEYEAVYRNFEIGFYELINFVLKVLPSHTREELKELRRQCLIEMGQLDFCGQWFFVSAWGRKPAG